MDSVLNKILNMSRSTGILFRTLFRVMMNGQKVEGLIFYFVILELSQQTSTWSTTVLLKYQLRVLLLISIRKCFELQLDEKGLKMSRVWSSYHPQFHTMHSWVQSG